MRLNFNISRYLRKTEKSIIIQSDSSADSQYSLTPSTIKKIIALKEGEFKKEVDNPSYQTINDIANKLKDKEIKNIAVTGPFGSGKSSVLLTLKQDFPEYQYLDISLATLEGLNDKTKNIENNNNSKPKDSENNSKSQKTNESKKENYIDDEEALNRKIEYSILQQLIYKEKAENIPQSRFKRIKHISNYDSYIIAFGVVLFIFSCCILFEPKFLRIQSFYRLFTCNTNWKIIWDLLFSGFVIFSLVYAISKLIIKSYNNRINKLNFKDGEIEIEESTSIFNKHLDEIIYFFEVTKYDIVIIEDLDRFDTSAIFLKLRELNSLLNNSNAIKRKTGKIVFIYAIKDDMFKDSSRTKFFDYIATVIPVINPSNSRDMLLNALKEKGIDEISDSVCMDLGIFIDDMRILKNTINEYIQYHQKLQNLAPEKMLGMILYKNYHPDDFSNLHNQKGIVYNIVSNRTKYHNSNVIEKEKEIGNLQQELKQITDLYSNKEAKELRALYIMKYIETNWQIQYFREENINYTPSQLIENIELFQKLENNIITHYYNQFTGYIKLNITFKEIEDKVDPNHSYRERLSFFPYRVNEINSKIEKLQLEISELRTLSLSQILNKYSADDFYRDAGENRLIAFLIRAGYIDENYYDYISYFYPGVMTPSDRDFILDLKIGRKRDANYIIYKPKAVISDIQDALFSKLEILNISLIDFIVENRSEYPSQYILLKNNIKKHNALDFIISYYKIGKQTEIFFKDILLVWSQFFTKAILKAKTKENADIHLEILLRYFPQSKLTEYTNTEFTKFISERFDFIVQKLDIILLENVIFLTESLNIKYNNLQAESSISKELMSFIIDGDYYKLTSTNIQCILNVINPEISKKYELASYSSIIESANSNFINYINKKIEDCISNVFPDSSTKESEETIYSIIGNYDISEETKIKYLSKQNNKIDFIDIIEDFWDIAIKADIIRPNWQNIVKYISIEGNKDFNTTIIDYISNHSSELSQQKISGPITDKIFIKLMGSNILPIESYKLIRKSFYLIFSKFSFSNLEIERVDFLIETGTILFDNENYKFIDDHFGTLTHKFILNNKKVYFSNINSYTLRATTAYSLLKNNQIKPKEKVEIIKILSISMLDKDPNLSNAICVFLNSTKITLADSSFVLELLKNGNSQLDKLNLFVRECIESTYDKEFVKSGLNLLGGDYAEISKQKGHRRNFDLNEDNRKLALFLEEKKFISKQKVENGQIKINARNI